MTAPSARAIAIGASAGGVQALARILPELPEDFPVPVLVVVHVPPNRENALVPLYQSRCRVTVKEAEDKEPLEGGTVYFAPSDYHLLVEADRTVALSSEEAVNHSRPAIDVLFETAADAYGPDLTAVVLTGANHDGAAGLAAVCAAGGEAIVQDPKEAEVATMPATALAACPTARVETLARIATRLLRLAHR